MLSLSSQYPLWRLNAMSDFISIIPKTYEAIQRLLYHIEKSLGDMKILNLPQKQCNGENIGILRF